MYTRKRERDASDLVSRSQVPSVTLILYVYHRQRYKHPHPSTTTARNIHECLVCMHIYIRPIMDRTVKLQLFGSHAPKLLANDSRATICVRFPYDVIFRKRKIRRNESTKMHSIYWWFLICFSTPLSIRIPIEFSRLEYQYMIPYFINKIKFK